MDEVLRGELHGDYLAGLVHNTKPKRHATPSVALGSGAERSEAEMPPVDLVEERVQLTDPKLAQGAAVATPGSGFTDTMRVLWVGLILGAGFLVFGLVALFGVGDSEELRTPGSRASYCPPSGKPLGANQVQPLLAR